MASTRLATFAPNEVSIIITQESTGVTHLMSGFSEDAIVTIDRNAETFSLYVGADDTPTRIRNADTSLMLTVSLQQTSNSNDVLSALYNNDRVNLNGVFSILVADNTGRSRFFAEEAYIAVVPNAQYANSMQTRDWVIHAPRSDITMGGNARFSSDDLAVMESLGVQIAPQWT